MRVSLRRVYESKIFYKDKGGSDLGTPSLSQIKWVNDLTFNYYLFIRQFSGRQYNVFQKLILFYLTHIQTQIVMDRIFVKDGQIV